MSGRGATGSQCCFLVSLSGPIHSTSDHLDTDFTHLDDADSDEVAARYLAAFDESCAVAKATQCT